MRLAYAGSSDSLVQESYQGGALWQAGRSTVDFSASYQVNKNITLTFDGQNLTEAPVRTYFTSRTLQMPNSSGINANYDEGTIYQGATKSRTLVEYNTGKIFRVGLRATF